MKLKLYLVSIILLASQSVFSQQHLEYPVFKSCADYSKTGVNINEAYHCYNFVANRKSSKQIPALVNTYFKAPAASVSTYNADLVGRSLCEKINKNNFDDCNTDALEAAVYLVNIVKGNVETEGSQVAV